MKRFLFFIHFVVILLVCGTIHAGTPSQKRVLRYAPIDVKKAQKEDFIIRGQAPFGASQKNNEEQVREILVKPLPEPGEPLKFSLKRDIGELLATSQQEAGNQQGAASPVVVEKPTETTPAPGNNSSALSGDPANIFVKSLISTKDPQKFIAIPEDGKPSFVATKAANGQYYDDVTKKLVVPVVDTVSTEAEGTLSPDKTKPVDQNNSEIFYLILASASTLAAIYIGYIAIDYHRRLEQALVTQNQKFTASKESLSGEPLAWEPETLSFSTSASLDSFSSSGSSFRTIA